ncbi:hypothetical protein [Amycolatopsis dendrobii]|uniref:Uncharacterized protein n=1 Tax=Amycolatopsis dendrobii TaxID=2760662 RepID=A0A7W3Z9C2_9PSEU|nr:hypothetical protein [Amycolatopsis dendrobii]MBB1152458.1 hypothetical protein [Amycolatopsis dendrobii]
MQRGERFLPVVVGDVFILDEDVLEERLVEQPSLLVVAAPVQLLWIVEQREAQFD